MPGAKTMAAILRLLGQADRRARCLDTFRACTLSLSSVHIDLRLWVLGRDHLKGSGF